MIMLRHVPWPPGLKNQRQFFLFCSKSSTSPQGPWKTSFLLLCFDPGTLGNPRNFVLPPSRWTSELALPKGQAADWTKGDMQERREEIGENMSSS